ncbi:MAG: beta-lactamase family protein [Oligosphaeraceae bacterium]|nr:beta-lactamase family protein [Oligosphaeraceae bacterium]
MSIEKEIRSILDARVSVGKEIGVQFAVMKGGKFLADACAGFTDESRTRTVSSDTLFPVFSTGKAFCATAALRLVERGELELERPVREIWPEFACNGKEEVTVRQIFMHRSGVCERPFYQNHREITDWAVMRQRVEKAFAEFPPGSRTQYQSVNYTWLLGELMLRSDSRKRTLQQIILQEAIQPYSTGMIYFGVDDEAAKRTVTLTRNPSFPKAPEPAPCWDYELEAIMNDDAIRRACLPGFNCIASARGLALHFSALLDGRILGKDILDEARKDISQPGDAASYGLGYAIQDNGNIFGHGGYGGAQVLANARTGIVAAYTCNLMHSDDGMRNYLQSLLEDDQSADDPQQWDHKTGQLIR